MDAANIKIIVYSKLDMTHEEVELKLAVIKRHIDELLEHFDNVTVDCSLDNLPDQEHYSTLDLGRNVIYSREGCNAAFTVKSEAAEVAHA